LRMRCFVPSICSNGKRLSDFLFDDIQQRFENMAVMDIPGCHDGGEEETVPVRGCVTGIGEFLLPLVFYVIATFGIGRAFLDLLLLFTVPLVRREGFLSVLLPVGVDLFFEQGLVGACFLADYFLRELQLVCAGL